MRKEINVLWLDDNPGEDLDLMKSVFSSVFEENGYIPVYFPCADYETADRYLNNHSLRIDFFVSDFNLEQDRSGLDFLVEIRKREKFKEFFVLYSNRSKDSMRHGIKDLIDSDLENADYLNNLYFFSTGADFNQQSIKKCFEAAVDLALVRWNELNALRGEHASINTLLEWTLRNIFQITDGSKFNTKRNNKDYSKCIDFLEEKINNHGLSCSFDSTRIANIFYEWNEMRKDRNTLEHNVEKWDFVSNDFLIEKNDHTRRFFEKDIVAHRKTLIHRAVLLKELFDDLFLKNLSISSVQFSDEYQSFINGF